MGPISTDATTNNLDERFNPHY